MKLPYDAIEEQLNIDRETFDKIISDESAKQEICKALFHCLENVPELGELASLLLQYIAFAEVREDADDEEGRWITTENGHKVHLNEEGEPDKGNEHVIAAMNGESGASSTGPVC